MRESGNSEGRMGDIAQVDRLTQLGILPRMPEAGLSDVTVADALQWARRYRNHPATLPGHTQVVAI